MKKIVLILVVTMITLYGYAQQVDIEQKDVPEVVTSAFKRMYPYADVIKWEKNHKEFVAHFDQDGMHHTVYFDEKGTRHRTKIKINEEVLPVNAKNYVSKNYPKEEFKEIEKITNRHGVTHYKIRIKDRSYYFDEQGNYIEDYEKVRDRERITKDGTVKEKEMQKDKVKKNGKRVERDRKVKKR